MRVLFSYGFFRHFNHIPRISKKLLVLVFMNNEYSFLLTNLQIKPLYSFPLLILFFDRVHFNSMQIIIHLDQIFQYIYAYVV